MNRGRIVLLAVSAVIVGMLTLAGNAPLFDNLASNDKPIERITETERDSVFRNAKSVGSPLDNTPAGEFRSLIVMSNDGPAQWASVLVSVLGLLVSIWAVVLVAKTLAATRRTITKADEANKVAYASVLTAREIGQAQIIGYPAIRKIELEILPREGTNSAQINLIISVQNSGNSPLRNVYVDATVWVPLRRYDIAHFVCPETVQFSDATERVGSLSQDGTDFFIPIERFEFPDIMAQSREELRITGHNTAITRWVTGVHPIGVEVLPTSGMTFGNFTFHAKDVFGGVFRSQIQGEIRLTSGRSEFRFRHRPVVNHHPLRL